MYKIIETDAEVRFGEGGGMVKPLVTLADEWGGRAQIVEDDHCLVVLLKGETGTYHPHPWLFPEVVDAIKQLETPKPA